MRLDVRVAIENRRSYRALAPVEITDAMVKKLAWAASMAPSCFNNQPWRLIFIRDAGMLERMRSALSEGNEWARDSSMLLVVLSKKDLDCAMKDGREYYQFDTGLAVGQLMLMATELGLVTHAMAGFSPRKTGEILGIPDEMNVITIVAIGKQSKTKTRNMNEDQWEAEEPRPERLDFPEFAYLEKYSSEQ